MRLYSYRTDPFDASKIAFSHLTTIPTAHTKTVRSIAWSPSGKTLTTGSFDANIRIWEQPEDDDESDEWECIGFLDGHDTECKCVAYSGTGALFATCSRDKTVWVWEGDLRVRSWRLPPLTCFPAPVSPDAEFQCLEVMMEHSQDVKCVSWHPTEEVVIALAECCFETDFVSEDRFSHRDPTTIRSSFMSTILTKTGFALRR